MVHAGLLNRRRVSRGCFAKLLLRAAVRVVVQSLPPLCFSYSLANSGKKCAPYQKWHKLNPYVGCLTASVEAQTIVRAGRIFPKIDSTVPPLCVTKPANPATSTTWSRIILGMRTVLLIVAYDGTIGSVGSLAFNRHAAAKTAASATNNSNSRSDRGMLSEWRLYRGLCPSSYRMHVRDLYPSNKCRRRYRHRLDRLIALQADSTGAVAAAPILLMASTQAASTAAMVTTLTCKISRRGSRS